MLDANFPENSDYDRQLTDNLYSGDQYHRLCQEAVLGIGGVRILKKLGYGVFRYHMNEGHASLLGLELLSQQMVASSRTSPEREDIERVRTRCVFTTHTPIPAGHDRFSLSLAKQVLEHKNLLGFNIVCPSKDELNMTRLGINLSHFVNGVSKKHREVSQKMFPDCSIQGITNGVHAASWIASPFKELYDRYAPGWQIENNLFRHALNIPDEELWAAHMKCKELLFDFIKQKSGVAFNTDIFTCGFARRSTAYKRPALIFSDRERLRSLSKKADGIQLIFAGKAHPADSEGKALIQSVLREAENLNPDVKIIFIPDYDVEIAHLLLAGCDLWLNTPTPPLEASGTSGMKAALNGVPSLSVLDGWWLEGCIEGVTGWAIEDQKEKNSNWSERDTSISLYEALEQKIIPVYKDSRDQFINIMRHAIAINGSFFNTERMLKEYIVAGYFSPLSQE